MSSKTIERCTNLISFIEIYLNGDDEFEWTWLRDRICKIADDYAPDGFLIAECQDLSSSHMGERIVLPYGGKATLPAPPTGLFSPRGLASDMSVVIATIETKYI